ncbi:UvrABC system protein A [Bacteroidota bacterium]|nr:UvrABC system protein A [Bacteroidota bacterium]
MTQLKTETDKGLEFKKIVDHSIEIKGARANNLKNISISIPKNKLIVVTGVSGSGKSSLTMDILFAEGQRRYVESLSSYARQFLGRMKKPEVDSIKGICPAIAIQQKVSVSNARSTVGTLTEIYDYIRLLFARIGKTYSPISNELVKKHEVSDVVDFILSIPQGSPVQVFIPLPYKYGERSLAQELDLLLQKGFTRILNEDSLTDIQDFIGSEDLMLGSKILDLKEKNLLILIDRFILDTSEESMRRIADSINTAFTESEGECFVTGPGGLLRHFNNRFELDGISFVEPAPQLFNFNNPFGACPNCEGFSMVMGIDPEKVIPDKSLSIYEGAVACWKGEKNGLWLEEFISLATLIDFPIHKPYAELSKTHRNLLWSGSKSFRGINAFFEELEAANYKIQNRVMLSRYRGKTVCPACEGSRLRKEALYVQIDGKTIGDLVDMPIDELAVFFESIQLSETDTKVSARLLHELRTRLKFMNLLGLSYLTLNRISATLSGGETQRINLTRLLGSNLTDSLYILDEPSVGLHPRDSKRLVNVLKHLKNLGNTVLIVEHEEDIIKESEYLIDIGPHAGVHGGEVIFAGAYENIYTEASESLTTGYLTGRLSIPIPSFRRKGIDKIIMHGATHHNLKNITVTFPLNTFIVVSGVSGSGKTTLVKHILFPALKAALGEVGVKSVGSFSSLSGDLKKISQVEMVNQNPIGKSSRSNPVTYVKAYDAIRELMASQPLSKLRDYKAKHFSFNVDGGRCDTCKGEGEQVIEMQFLADMRLECESCGGKRFKNEVLEVRYREKNIYDILKMTIEESLVFFKDSKEIITKLNPLMQVGLGYVCLGQSSNTLSGGEAQRVKLASFLGQEKTTEKYLFIFDEPTTGLHFHDISKLLEALQALVEKGHTVLVIEHNMEIIKSADWVIDLGPEGGKMGGNLVFQGTPEDLVHCLDSPTAPFLAEKLSLKNYH